MKIRMLVEVSGTRNGMPWPRRNEAIDLPSDEAASLCAAGMAEPVTDDRVETATAPAAEKRAPVRTRKQG